MEIKTSRWGNSIGFRIPKALQDISNIHDKTRIKIEAEPNRLIITKIPEKLTLETLFENWNEEPYELTDEDKEWLEMKPVGKERFWEEK